MKRMYIPKGTIEKHENIYTDELVVKGRLIVTGAIHAKKVYGSGMIEAERINAGTIVADTLEVNLIYAKRIIANKIFSLTIVASTGVIAKDFIESYKVKTPRLTTTFSRIEISEASEIVRLQPKRSFITAIFCSWLYERFAVWRHSRVIKRNNAVLESECASKKASTDIEFENIINEYREKYREGGYRLVLEAVAPKPKVI